MSLKFLHPAAFWLLLLIPVLLGLKLWGDARARRSVGRLASPRLMPSLLSGRTGRIGWVMFGLEVLAFILFAAALARPQYGVIMEESEGKGRNVIVAIDTSKSMLANDLAPSRLERAMLAAEDLVKETNRMIAQHDNILVVRQVRLVVICELLHPELGYS